MRSCPACNVPLEPEDYEGFRILHCPQCRGHLAERSRFEAIRSLAGKSPGELETEARNDFSGDNPNPIRCPRCRRPMEKRPLPVPGFDNLHVDVCRDCLLVWFDGGELALAQLAHQNSPAYRNQAELRRRAESLDADPERKAAFDEAVSRLPLDRDSLAQGVEESFADALRHVLLRILFRFPF